MIAATTVLPEHICPLVAAARSTIARPAHRGSLPPLAPLLVNPVSLARPMQIRTRQRSAAHVATARMPAVAVPHANRVGRGAVMATVTRRPRARCATQGSSGSTRVPLLSTSVSAFSALPAKQTLTLTAPPVVSTVSLENTPPPALPCAPAAQTKGGSTTTVTPPRRAQTRISASRCVRLAPMTATATTPHPVWHATLAGLPLEGSPSLRLGVILVRQARQIIRPV
eukprot:COSAG03_NODE_2087_length_3143_cov_33.161629_2_plen_226_part_00